MLTKFKTKINLHNGGSSKVYGRQGSISFITHTPKRTSCPVCTLEPQIKNKFAFANPPVERIISKHILNDVYVGAGFTFMNSPISTYVGSILRSYTVGFNHKLIPFTLMNGNSNFYAGIDLSFSTNNHLLGPTSITGPADVRYVRNNYAFVLGIERYFSALNSLAIFGEFGPAAQERTFILSLNNGPTENAYSSRRLGIVSNLGLKYKFLETSDSLEKIGIEHLFTRAAVNYSFGQKISTDPLPYKSQPDILDINQYSWGVMLTVGAAY